MHTSLAQWALAVSGLILEIIIILTMTQRKLRSIFPIFFCYVALQSLAIIFPITTLINCTTFGFAQGVFYGYWAFLAVSMLLGFGILYEVFVNALKPYSAVIDLGKLLFFWAAIFLVAAAVLTALATSDQQFGKVIAAILLVQRSLRLMQCGLLMLLIAFESRLGLSWRSHGFSIALGLGVYAAVNLIGTYVSGGFPDQRILVANVDGLAFVAAMALWAVRLSFPEPARSTAADSPKRLILQRWNEALVSYGYGPARASNVESFLPGIEKTVERVMARTIH